MKIWIFRSPSSFSALFWRCNSWLWTCFCTLVNVKNISKVYVEISIAASSRLMNRIDTTIITHHCLKACRIKEVLVPSCDYGRIHTHTYFLFHMHCVLPFCLLRHMEEKTNFSLLHTAHETKRQYPLRIRKYWVQICPYSAGFQGYDNDIIILVNNFCPLFFLFLYDLCVVKFGTRSFMSYKK